MCSGLSAETTITIINSRAPSTRRLYGFKWRFFASWCRQRALDPVHCPIGSVLEFLFSEGVTPATLKVYVVAIFAGHALVGDVSVGHHPLVSRFMQGARRLKPFRPIRVPSWNLLIVMEGLLGDPFEPFESVSVKLLTLKTVLLLALSSLKSLGDFQALSLTPLCMDFAPGLVKVLLRPRPDYVPTVALNPFRFQQVVLEVFSHFSHAFLPSPTRDQVTCLCPVRALRTYVDRTAQWRGSDQLFVCFGSKSKGSAVTKQRMSHWIVEAISLAYKACSLTSPLRLRAHSTRAVASSQAFLKGSSMEEICAVAGWSSPSTFIKFYSLDMRMAPAPGSYPLEQMLSLVSSYIRYVRCYGITFPKRWRHRSIEVNLGMGTSRFRM